MPGLEERLRGGYFRAFVLQSEGEVDAALRLVAELAALASGREPELASLRLRIARLRARLLLRQLDPAGRRMMIEVADASHELAGEAIDRGEHELFLSDLCTDLGAIGEHDRALVISREVAQAASDPALQALRLTNLAVRLRQRAVVHRAAGDPAAARADIEEAVHVAQDALDARRALVEREGLAHRASVRATRTVLVGCALERHALGLASTAPVEPARTLLRETLDAGDDAPLQVATRVAALGSAHLRRTDVNRLVAARAAAYLRHGWNGMRAGYTRPWVALDLEEALRAAGEPAAARRFAAEALAILDVQCGPDYPPSALLRGRESSGLVGS